MPTGQKYSSVAILATLTSGISSSSTTCSVNSTSGFPVITAGQAFTVVLDPGQSNQEICDVTNVTGLTLTITRQVDNSTAQSHGNNAQVMHGAIGRDFREARAHIEASGSNDSTGAAVHGLAMSSNVVGTTDTQTLSNKTLTTPTATKATVTNVATTDVPLTVNGIASTTADLVDVNSNGSPVLASSAQGPSLTVNTLAAANVGLRVVGQASQAGDLVAVRDSASNLVFRVAADGASGAGAVIINSKDTVTPPLQVTAPSDLVVQKIFRGTDSSPTANLLEFWNHANSTRLAFVDPTGVYNGPGTTSMVQLASTVVTNGTTSVTLSSISQSYNHLFICYELGSNGGSATTTEDMLMQWNGDTAGHYARLNVFGGFGSAAPSLANNSSATSAVCGSLFNATTPALGSGQIFIPNYTVSAYHQFNMSSIAIDGGLGGSNQGIVSMGGGGNNQSTAITSIKLFPGVSSAFKGGGLVTLYGML